MLARRDVSRLTKNQKAKILVARLVGLDILVVAQRYGGGSTGGCAVRSLTVRARVGFSC